MEISFFANIFFPFIFVFSLSCASESLSVTSWMKFKFHSDDGLDTAVYTVEKQPRRVYDKIKLKHFFNCCSLSTRLWFAGGFIKVKTLRYEFYNNKKNRSYEQMSRTKCRSMGAYQEVIEAALVLERIFGFQSRSLFLNLEEFFNYLQRCLNVENWKTAALHTLACKLFPALSRSLRRCEGMRIWKLSTFSLRIIIANSAEPFSNGNWWWLKLTAFLC